MIHSRYPKKMYTYIALYLLPPRGNLSKQAQFTILLFEIRRSRRIARIQVYLLSSCTLEKCLYNVPEVASAIELRMSSESVVSVEQVWNPESPNWI